MENEITKNLVFLSNNIGNLENILLHLQEKGIITTNERHGILLPGTPLEKNTRFLDIIIRKGYNANKKLIVEILRKTKNKNCADKIQGIKRHSETALRESFTDERLPTPRRRLLAGTVMSIILAISAISIAALFQYINSTPSITHSSPAPIIRDNNVPVTHGGAVSTIENNLEHQQIWFGVTAPNRFYVGREKEMDLLERYWNTSRTQKTLSIVAVTGLGGVGKSELAKNYATWFYENVEGHCIWIKAESNQSIEESFRNLAEKNLKISLNDHLGKEKKFLIILEEVFEKLFGEKVLLVFDNVENYELPVLQWLIDLSSEKPPRVLKPFLITTSRVIEANKYFECNTLDLQVLTNESANNFFYKSLSVDEPPEDNIKELIEKLCERLQFFPLAMQQAAAYIKEKHVYSGHLHEVIENYLDQMEKISKILLNHKLPKYGSSISNTTFLTWRITFDTIQEESGGLAIDIMNIISFLSPDNIPTQMVTRILQKMGKVSDIGNIDNFFELIRKYSMISFSQGKSISVHRLVQEVTRIQLKERGEIISILSGVSNCLTEMLTTEEISLKDLVHVKMVWQHLKRDKAMIADNAKIVVLICKKFLNSGRYRDLLDFSTESGDLLEFVFGQNGLFPLEMKHVKGIALRELGEYSESIEVLKYSYEKRKEIFGVDGEDFLDTSYEIGGAYFGLGKYQEAMNIYKDALEINERIHGKEHRRTLLLKNGIALVLRAQHKLQEALKIYNEILEVEEQLLGVEYLDTLTTKHNIAIVKFDQKSYSEALKEFQEVLEIEERLRELNHPNILNTKSFIANIYYYLGSHRESLKLFQEVHKNQLQILGPRHPQTITTERWIEKVELLNALLASSTTEFSSIPSEIRTFVMNMFKAKDISLDELVEVQIIWKHLSKDNEMDEEDGKSLSGICTECHRSGKYKILLDFSSKFEELLESVLAKNNRWTLRIKYWKGVALRELGQYSDSMEVLKHVWEMQKSIFDEEHDDCLDTAEQVGNLYYLLNKYEDAMEFFENILEKMEVMLGNEHARILSLKNSIALVLDAQNKYDEALTLYIDILELRERLFGVDNFNTLTTKYNIALVKLKQKDYGEALKEFQEVLEIQERVLELNHPSTLTTKHGIAVIYFHLGRYEESLQLLTEVYVNRFQVLGPGHPLTIDAEKCVEIVEMKVALHRSMTEF